MAVKTSITSTLPPDTYSTNSVIMKPMPVSVIAPTMRPALAVATPMPIMLRAPRTSPFQRSPSPRRSAAPISPCRLRSARSGGCSTTVAITVTVAQNAESPGDSSSTMRHQRSTTRGTRKWNPARTVGQSSGSRMTGAFGSSIGRSG